MIYIIISVLSIAAVALVYLIYYYVKKKKYGSLSFKRSGAFWKRMEIISTNVTYPAVREAIRKGDFSACGATVSLDHRGDERILFRSSHGWKAVIDYNGFYDGKYEFLFYFSKSGEGGNGSPYWKDSMLSIKDAVEEMFVELDQNVTFKSRKL